MVINRQASWVDIYSGVSQVSLINTLLFLIHINDIAEGLPRKSKSLGESISLFPAV